MTCVGLVKQHLRSFSLGLLFSHFNNKSVLLHMVDAFQIQEFVFAFEFSSPLISPACQNPSALWYNSQLLHAGVVCMLAEAIHFP